MLPPFDSHEEASSEARPLLKVVVAGPSSTVTVPGLMTSEVIGSLAPHARITRVAVDMGKNFNSGLDRAAALSPRFIHGESVVRTLRAPLLARQRRVEFRQYFKDPVDMAVALAWPGFDNSWIGEYVNVARQSGAVTAVLVITHPTADRDATLSLTREVAEADVVLVGDIIDATLLSSALGSTRPVIEVSAALSLNGRTIDPSRKRLTTFLPKDDEQSLVSVLAAFDAIPEDWVEAYDLRVIMRYSGHAVPDHVAASYHSDHVQLIGEDFSSLDLRQLATDSSVMSVADPAFDSRAFSTAVDAGVATVVMAENMETPVGEGYVGGLLADLSRPASVYVALNHALRLSELHFPAPEAWFKLAQRLEGAARHMGTVWSEDSSSQFA